jgi:hypothetical protein
LASSAPSTQNDSRCSSIAPWIAKATCQPAVWSNHYQHADKSPFPPPQSDTRFYAHSESPDYVNFLILEQQSIWQKHIVLKQGFPKILKY